MGCDELSTIYLIRHGETDWNREGRAQGIEDIELNAEGEQQAHQCGYFLQQENFDLILSSPLKRAYKTAMIIARYHNQKVDLVEGLHERSFGHASGLTREEREKLYPDGLVPEMEDWFSFRDRVMDSLYAVLKRYPKQKILLVTHGGVINAILHTISDGNIGTGKTKLKNGCLSILYYKDGQWKVGKYNCIEHL